MNDLLRAKEAIQKEVDTCQQLLLNSLADITTELGDEELAMGYRWMAERCIWPAASRNPVDGVFVSCKTTIGWDFENAYENNYIRSYEIDRTISIFDSSVRYYASASEILEIAAREIGQHLKLNEGKHDED